MNNIKQKNILLFCPPMYFYYERIEEQLYKDGANRVVTIQTPIFRESFRNVNKYNRRFYTPLVVSLYYLKNPQYRHKWSKKVLQKIHDEHFDVVLSIGDVPFDSSFFDEIKRNNRDVKFYLFLWDKLDVRKVPKCIINKFDYKFSFDRDDCKEVNGLEYFPDFYIDEGDNPNDGEQYDISFIGTLQEHQRGVIIKALDSFCKENGLKYYFRLVRPHKRNATTKNPLKKLYRSLLKDRAYYSLVNDFKNETFFSNESLSLKEVSKIQKASRCLVDISYKNRQGMTINAITALATGKKLLTANNRIKDEPFFDPSIIYIFDPENPYFDIEFFNTPVKSIDLSYLRLDNWLRHILNR